MALLAGSRLGPHEILAPLGAGGMGEVYRARDTRLGRDVAVKVLPPAFAADADRLRRFEKEARTAGALNHPGLVTLFDVGTHEGSPYLVMELLEGETLRQKLAGKPLPVKRAIEIARAVAEGLSAAHGQGVTHRDLKPENLFVTRDGRIKILDFGLAKLTARPTLKAPEDEQTQSLVQRNEETREGVVLGTAGYMSPEQVRGDAVDGRSDIFSLGIIFWEMLTGKRPFRGASAVESMHAILKDEPPDIDPSLKLPPVVESIVRTCLSKDPASRFQSAHDLAFALSCLPGSASSPVSPIQAVPKTRRLWAWVLAVAVLGLIAGAFFLGRLMAPPRLLHVERLTETRKVFSSARFLPDGKSIVYTAAPEGAESDNLGELFRLDPGEPPTPLGVRDCRVLDVSSSGELLLVWKRENPKESGKEPTPVLAKLPSAGGTAPRVLEEDSVTTGDRAHWTRDGKDYVAKHSQYLGKRTQAFVYQGRSIYEVPYGFWVGEFELHEKENVICFVEFRSMRTDLVTVGLDGQVRTRTPVKESVPVYFFPFREHFIALSLDRGRENPLRITQLSVSGVLERTLHNLPADARLWDVNPAGELLMGEDTSSGVYDLRWLEPGAARERIMYLGTASFGPALNASGDQLSFTSRTWLGFSAQVIQSGQPAPTDLGGDGQVMDQSPDGKTLLILSSHTDGYHRLRLLPTGSGTVRELPGQWIFGLNSSLQGSGKAFVYGLMKGDTAPHRPYLLDAEKGTVQRPEWSAARVSGPVSPDGRFAFASETPGRGAGMSTQDEGAPWSRVDLMTGAMTQFPASCSGMVPQGWTASGEGVWLIRSVTKDRAFPLEIWNLDLKTGKLQKARSVTGPDYPLGNLWDFNITPDGRSYAYLYSYAVQVRTHLYRVSGVVAQGDFQE